MTKHYNKREYKQTAGNLSHITFNWDKKSNHSNACYDLKGLVLVVDPCLVAGKDILEVPRDCVLCSYHSILFQKDQEEFWALITQEQSQHLDPDRYTKAKSVPRFRRMHQASRFDQPMPEVIRLMVFFLRTKMVGKNVWTYLENCTFLGIKAVPWFSRVCIEEEASRFRSTNIETHKIDGSTLKPFSMVQAIILSEACLLLIRLS